MLLAAESLGLGACWIGEILKNENKVQKIKNAANNLQLMAAITVGYSDKSNAKSKRRLAEENILAWM